MSNKNEEIREQVKHAYAKAVTTENKNMGCCGPKPKGILAKEVIEYSKDDLASLPEDAVENSFGCGNPLAFSDVKEGEVVLDLGSGAGIDILIAAKKVGEKGRVIGVDMTPEMIERARQNIKSSGFQNVEVRMGTIENLPVDDNSVDWVISNCVINLSPEKEKVFSEIYRFLKKGGKMQVSDIVVDSLPEWIKNIPAVYNSCVGGAVSEEEYINHIKKTGLSNVKVKSKLVYDDLMIKGLISSETQEISCCSKGLGNIIDNSLENLSGKISSVKVYAEKS